METATTDVQEKLDALEDEVNLLKNEMKQSLVDLREIVMDRRTLFSQRSVNANSVGLERPVPPVSPGPEHGNGGLPGIPTQSPSGADTRDVATLGNELRMAALDRAANSGGVLDAAMLGNFICWLGTVKIKGMSLQRIIPYLETYERAGYLTSAMAKLMLLSMADLDQLGEPSSRQPLSFQDYSECLCELHEIVCTPGYTLDHSAAAQSG